MSHISRIELEITSLYDLKEACSRLGFTFMENQKTHAWYGKLVGDTPLAEGMEVQDLGKCDHAIKVPECDYEVGVIRQGKKYHLVYDDWYRGGLDKKIGILKQAYSVVRIKNESHKKGYRVRQIKTENAIRLVLSA